MIVTAYDPDQTIPGAYVSTLVALVNVWICISGVVVVWSGGQSSNFFLKSMQLAHRLFQQ